jgi:hypothetical protein
MPRQPPLEDAQSDRGNVSDGKMDTQKIGHHPVHAAQPLPSWGRCGIPRGLSATGGPFAAQGPQERCGMMGMDVRLCQGTSCLRMGLPGTLLLGALSTFFLPWCPFILDAAVPPSVACLLGSSGFSRVPKGRT